MKRIVKATLTLAAMTALAIGFMPSMSHAVSCTVDVVNNPDPNISGASGSGSSSCGLGSSDSTNAGIESFMEALTGSDLTLIDKTDDGTSGTHPNALTGTNLNGGNSGNWYLDTAGLTGDIFLIMKDGGTGNTDANSPPEIQWVWFELDLNGNCVGFGGAPAAADLCGTWQMWGGKGLSHFSVYSPSGTPSGTPSVPEPSALILLGAGLLASRIVLKILGTRNA
jgi:hypothetical protein